MSIDNEIILLLIISKLLTKYLVILGMILEN